MMFKRENISKIEKIEVDEYVPLSWFKSEIFTLKVTFDDGESLIVGVDEGKSLRVGDKIKVTRELII